MSHPPRSTLLLVWIAGLALGAAGYAMVWKAGAGAAAKPDRKAASIVTRPRREPPLEPAEVTRLVEQLHAEADDSDGLKDVVRALILHPELINKLWEQTVPDEREAVMRDLFYRLWEDCPAAMWAVVEQVDFELPIASVNTAICSSTSSSPMEALKVAERKEKILGPQLVDDIRTEAVKDEDVALMLLERARGGSPISDATAWALWDSLQQWQIPQTLPAEVLSRPEIAEHIEDTRTEKAVKAWLAGDAVTPEDLKKMPEDALEYWGSSDVQPPVAPQRLEDLAAAGRAEEGSLLIAKLVGQGRTDQAEAMVAAAAGMPSAAAHLDDYQAELAQTLYLKDHDSGSALRRVGSIADPTRRQEALESLMSAWSGAAPEELRAYLPQIADAELRERIEAELDSPLKP